jgi:hypothetical protein
MEQVKYSGRGAALELGGLYSRRDTVVLIRPALASIWI